MLFPVHKNYEPAIMKMHNKNLMKYNLESVKFQATSA